jgi:DNA-binding transcriptional LysR family regulator
MAAIALAPSPTPASAPSRALAEAALAELEPRLLRTFVVLGEELHFTRAADRLWLEQPAVSRAIRRLEGTVGTALFTRTTRSVALTPAGARLLEPARAVLDAYTALGDELTQREGLRLAHVPGSDTAARVIERYRQLHPAAALEESVLSDEQQLAALRRGELDVAICPFAGAAPRDLDARRIRFDPLLAAVPDGGGGTATRAASAPGSAPTAAFGGASGTHAVATEAVDPRRMRLAVATSGGRLPTQDAFVTAFRRAAGFSLAEVAVAVGSGTELRQLAAAAPRGFLLPASTPIRPAAPWRVVGTVPLQAYLPWAIVTRRGEDAPAVRDLVACAGAVAHEAGWLALDGLPGTPWPAALRTG